MCDQLRWDYLSCYGHPHLRTPNIDGLAARGVRFTRAYCQAPLCGPSRSSFHTGRYMSSHGAMANEDPLRPGELTLGDCMRDLGVAPVLVGKMDVTRSRDALDRLGVDADSAVGRAVANGGFEPFEKLEGLYPDPILPPRLGYNDYLRARGYHGENPWELYANSATDADGRRVSGWRMRHAGLPARVAEAHSETAFTTDRAIEFLEQTPDDRRWCLHLSYIKPHWPYIAPDPYHRLHTPDHVLPAVRGPDAERENPHPVQRAFMAQDYSENFSRDEVRERVIPTYMGLIRQVDDHLGRLLRYLDERGLTERTLIAFTSDHGDYLGDHWLGEKDLFHDCSARIPMILCDPSPQADATRGTTDSRFVEAVDLLPTFVEFAGGEVRTERVEGRSLLGILRGEDVREWRDFAVSEIDFSDRGTAHPARRAPLGVPGPHAAHRPVEVRPPRTVPSPALRPDRRSPRARRPGRRARLRERPAGAARPAVRLVPPPPQPHRDAGGNPVRDGSGARRASRDHDRALVAPERSAPGWEPSPADLASETPNRPSGA